MTTAELLCRWRAQAAQYDRDGVTIAARILARCADELEATAATSAEATVSLNDAARLSGYSPDHLGRLVRGGKLANHGTRHRPRIRIADLPRKALTGRANVGIVGAQWSRS